MSISLAEQLHTGVYRFPFDKDVAVHVHRGVIAALSSSFERVILDLKPHESFKDVIFPSLTREDFERICEFAYRGDYSVPEAITFKANVVDPKAGSLRYADAITKFPRQPKERDTKPNKDSDSESETESPRDTLREHIMDKDFPLVGWTRKHSTRNTSVKPNENWAQNYAPVFLGHDRRTAKPGIAQIHQTLTLFTLYGSGYSAIVELARYVYDHRTLPERQKGTVDPLRELVVEFVALNIDNFNSQALHRDLMAEGGEYAADLLDKILKWQL